VHDQAFPMLERGLTTLIQLLVTTPSTSDGEIWLPAALILDAPRYAWRGLSLDLARRFFALDDVRRVVDLLALYKLNVRHVHLTDDQRWRLPVGRPAQSSEPDGTFYNAEDLRALVAYAADPFVTVVPEIDTPRTRIRASATAPRVEQRSERPRVRAPTRSQAPHSVARPGAARHLRADRDGAGRRCRDLPQPIHPHRRC
jgi:N-acetyl-beta-hexosaminidase